MLNKIIVNPYNLWVVIFAAVGTISTAYGLAIIGSTVGEPNLYTYFNLAPQGAPGYDHTTRIIAALNGVNSAGAVAGCMYHVWSAERFGRKLTMIVGCSVLVVGGALCAGSVHIAMFIVGRGVAGVGSGVLACVVPMYQAEVSTPETRGAMVSVTGIAYSIGYSLAGWLGYACSFMSGNSPHAQFSWRFPLAFQCVFPLIFLLGQKFVPRSPRWLLSQGRKKEAFDIVCALHKTKGDPNNIRAREEFYLIQKQFEIDSSLPNKWVDLFKTAPNRKRAMVGAMLMFGNQLLGVYVIANYGVLIYGQLGQGSSISLLLNACWNTFTMFGNSWTAFYVDRFGRRTLLLIGAIGTLVSCIFLCALSAEYLGSTNQAGLKAAVFFCFFYIFWWCFFMDATQYVYVAEIFPNHLRSVGVAFSLSSFYVASEITLCVAPIAMDEIGWKFYLVLICPSAIFIVLLYLYLPETKGRTLEEIGALFGDTNIANTWYGLTEEKKNEIWEQAMREEKEGGGKDAKGSGDAQSENVEDVAAERGQ
ncbi:general substrate transporter [Aspergillus undulatus]|uniref:general substrate transporter n=1 Tax=Aspergillus undulatus TaxID=1810928 RepID=UPI003CCDCF33